MNSKGTPKPVPPPRRVLATTLTFAGHVAVLAMILFWPRATPLPQVETHPLVVSLVQTPRLEAPMPPAPAEPTPAAPSVASHPPSIMIATSTPDTSDLLSPSQLAGAASADGAGSGGCDTARTVQQAMRNDPLVQTAVAQAHRLDQSVMLWNGDWVRSGAQEGKGLSAVREAILWALAFAPQACRSQPMHGLVLLSLADGSTRFAIGADNWRWSDLLGVSGH
jgi:hypothetical protein